MDETFRIWVETGFNLFYLIVISCIVTAMVLRFSFVEQKDKAAAFYVMLAFFFLALGDLGHVGARVVAFAMGGLDAQLTIFGRSIMIAPVGSIMTAWTFTLFYVCMVLMWKARFNKKLEAAAYIIFLLAIIRSILMLLPGNIWDGEHQDDFSFMIRNIPLVLMQVGTVYLILRDAIAEKDSLFKRIGALIIISFVCYMPVVFLLTYYPLIGMLMIPKTIAYMVIAFISLRGLFPKKIIT